MGKKRILTVMLMGLMVLGYAEDSGELDRYDIPYKNEKQLDVDLDFSFGSLNIRPSVSDDFIMRAGMTYSRKDLKPSIIYRQAGNRGKLALGTTGNHVDISLKEFNKMKEDSESNTWRLEFIKSIPTNFDLEFGAGEGNLDLSGMTVETMEMELAMGDVQLYFNQPNQTKMKKMSIETGLGSFEARGLGNANISDFALECGLGSSYLVFDGNAKGQIKADVSVGLGSVNIEISRDIAVEIRSESSFLSSVDFEDFDKIGNGLYRSPNWGTHTKARMFLDITVGMGSANVSWIE